MGEWVQLSFVHERCAAHSTLLQALHRATTGWNNSPTDKRWVLFVGAH